MDCSLSPLFKNLGSFRTFAVLSCEPVAISLSLGEIVTELMPCIKRWTKFSTQDTARHSTKLITLYWQKFLTLSPDRSKSFYTQQEQYVKWDKKIFLNLLSKLFMSISDQRGNIKKEHLSFFSRLRSVMTIPFHSLTSRSTLESMSASEQLRTNPSTVLPNNSQLVTSLG